MKRIICHLLWRFHAIDAALFLDDTDILSMSDTVVRIHYGRRWVTWWEVTRDPWELWLHRVPARLVTEVRRTW